MNRCRWKVLVGLLVVLSVLGLRFTEAPAQASPAPRLAILVVGDRSDAVATQCEAVLRLALKQLRESGELAAVRGLARDFLRYDLQRKGDAAYLQRLGIRAGRSPRLLLVDLDASGRCAGIRWGMPVDDVDVAMAALRRQLGLREPPPVAAAPVPSAAATQAPSTTAIASRAIAVVVDSADPRSTTLGKSLRSALTGLRAGGALEHASGMSDKFLLYDMGRPEHAAFLRQRGMAPRRAPRLMVVDLDAHGIPSAMGWSREVEDVDLAIDALRRHLGLEAAPQRRDQVASTPRNPLPRSPSARRAPEAEGGRGSNGPEAAWEIVRRKVQEARDYVVTIRTTEGGGTMLFRHAAVVGGPRVRTEVLRGSDRNVGMVLVFDPASDPSQVVARIGLGNIRRSLQHRDVQGTFFYQPAFSLVIREAEKGAVRGTFELEPGGGAMFTFLKSEGSKVLVWCNAGGEIVKAEWRSPEGRTIKVWTFLQPAFNVGPSTSL